MRKRFDPDELQFEDTDEYRPLTDEEMEAELKRVEAYDSELEDDDSKVAEEEAPDSEIHLIG